MNVVTIFNIRRANPRWSLSAYCAAAALALVGSFRWCWEAQSAGPDCDSDRIVQDDEVEETAMQSFHSKMVFTAARWVSMARI